MQFPSLNYWKQFFKILSRKEKLVLGGLAILAVGSATALIAIFWQKHTIEVAAGTGSYTEGVVGQPRFLNPVYVSSSGIDSSIARLLYANLLEYDQNGQIVSGLADYKISDDGKTYEFILKDGLYWSDGKPITSDDAIYTIKIIQDPIYKSPLRAQWLGVETERISDSGFRLKLKNPYSSFLENCVIGPIPQHVWETADSKNFALSPFNLKPVVSGPYRVKKLNLSKDGVIKSVELERNPKFFGKKPNLEQIIFAFFDNYDDLVAAFKSGRVQGFTPSFDLVGLNSSGMNSYDYFMPRYFAIFFNPNNNKALADSQVRTALSYATDKNEILNAALDKKGVIVDSPLPANIYSLAALSTIYNYDIQKAEETLELAGYKRQDDGPRVKTVVRQHAFQFTKTLVKGTKLSADVKELQKCLAQEVMPDLETNGNFGDKTFEAVKLFQEKYRKDILDPQGIDQPNGQVKQATREKLNETCFPSGNATTPLIIKLTVANQEPLLKAAQNIKSQWEKIGVAVDINPIDIVSFERDVVKPRVYEALLFGQALGMIPDLYPFWHSNQKVDPGLNFALYENKDVDKLLEEIRTTADQNARSQKLESVQNLIAKDAPAIFLYNPSYTHLVSESVKGINSGIIASPSQIFADAGNWFVTTKRVLKR